MKKIKKLLFVLLLAICLIPGMTYAKERLVIDFGKIHHSADFEYDQVEPLYFLSDEKGLIQVNHSINETGTEVPYILTAQGDVLVNAVVEELDYSGYPVYPLVIADGVQDGFNIDYEFVPEDEAYFQTFGSDIYENYSGITLKYEEDQQDSEDIYITKEDILTGKMTERQRYAFFTILYDKKVTTDADGNITDMNGKVLFNYDQNDGTFTAADNLTAEDNIEYEFTNEDFANSYSRLAGKRRVIVKFAEQQAAPNEAQPQQPTKTTNPANNPKTLNNGLIVIGLLSIVGISALLLKRKKSY